MGRLAVVLVLASLALLEQPAAGQAPAAPVALIRIEGAITPVTVRLIAGAVERAQADRAPALVLELDTPGGLERSMRSIVQTILNAEIPVIVYVAPTGARAASAACHHHGGHVAAMAPARTSGLPPGGGGRQTSTRRPQRSRTTRLLARSIAGERGRNADGGEGGAIVRIGPEREAVAPQGRRPSGRSVPELCQGPGRIVKTVRGRSRSRRGRGRQAIEVRSRRFLA